jgi:3-methyladenine DNA glycosylase/8-oxoguanine DNA glycosylase
LPSSNPRALILRGTRVLLVDQGVTKQLDRLGEPYRPYRTVLTWCCWKANEVYGHIQK